MLLLSWMLALLSIAKGINAFNASDPNCSFANTRYGSKAVCTYRNGKYIRKMPENFENMIMTIYSGSGGAALDVNDQIDTISRGLGIQMKAKIDDNTLNTGVFSITTWGNGEDATLRESGDRRNIFTSGGSGGVCPAGAKARHSGAGGDSSVVYFHQHMNQSWSSIIHLGGGGGAGAYNTVSGHSKGGNAGLIDRYNNIRLAPPPGLKVPQNIVEGTRWIIAAGNSGLPATISGAGARAWFPAKGGQGINGGNGFNGFYNSTGAAIPNGWKIIRDGTGGDGKEEYPYCYSGGGGGSGVHPGGGGGAYGATDDHTGSAGGGGGGSSEIDDTKYPMYTILHQEHHYDPDPRIVFTFDIPIVPGEEQKPAHSASAASSGHVKRKTAILTGGVDV